jgi:hypothetical protein
MDRHDWLVLLGGLAVVALFTLLANTHGDNQIYGKSTREIAPKAK